MQREVLGEYYGNTGRLLGVYQEHSIRKTRAVPGKFSENANTRGKTKLK